MTIDLKPGIYHVAMAEYLAMPAVSASLLHTLIDRCPRAAWWESWMNPHREPDESTDAQDFGTIAHAILLEGSEACVEVINPEDHPNETGGGHAKGWTNKSIKAARTMAIANGKIPYLSTKIGKPRAMAAAGRAYLDSLKDSQGDVYDLFQPEGGQSELTIVWEDQGVLCKLRADRIRDDGAVVVDLKSTEGSAQPAAWGRANLAGRMGYSFKAAHYRRGIRAQFKKDVRYYWLAGEQDAPYLHALIGQGPDWAELGEQEVQMALDRWRACLKAREWPGYPAVAIYPDLPGYESTRSEERAQLAGIAQDANRMGREYAIAKATVDAMPDGDGAAR